MYLIENNHEGIVSRDIFQAVQAELARRSARRSPSKKVPTGKGCYSSKYALSERLICGECGTLYRRCTWARNGKKRVVWRCVSRLDYGPKYCHSSPTIDELPLQQAILSAINQSMSGKETLMQEITAVMKTQAAENSGSAGLAEIARRLGEINEETSQIVGLAAEGNDLSEYTERLKTLKREAADLKEQQAVLEAQYQDGAAMNEKLNAANEIMERTPAELTLWDDSVIRQLVDTVKVLSESQIEVYLTGGTVIRQTITK